MSKQQYNKPPLTYPQLLQQLKDRGLTIKNEDKALHLIKNISYYRLSGYWYPLLKDKQKHIFKANATFETAFKLYCFDQELRLLVLREVEKIEVAVRSKMNHILAAQHGVYWFIDSSLFTNRSGHSFSLKKLKKDFGRSDEQFIKSFKRKYTDAYPPCWMMMMEITSFGKVSKLYANLKPGRPKREIANRFGLKDKTFSSWIHTMVYIRNVCAHHNRLWNRVMSIQPAVPKSPQDEWLNKGGKNNKTYFILSMIIYFLNTVNPNHSFRERFILLLEKYPNIDTRAMGFPTDWKNEKLWN